MRRFLLLFILCSATLGIYAQHGKLSAGTRIIISDREGRFSLEKSKKEMALLKSKKKTLSSQQDTIEPKEEEESLPFATPFTLKGQKVVQCWINMTDNDYSGIEALGVLIQTKFDKRVIANIPVNVLEKVAALKNVTKVSVAKKLKKHTYRSRVLTNVDDVLYLTSDAKTAGLLQAYDGTGVVLGIIDTGIQFSHAMFKDANGNSRIKKAYIYDESVGDLVEYSGSAVSSLTYDTADETHGTHTSAIAGGSDYTATAYVYTTNTSYTTVQNAKFGGMAPNADLVLCGLGDELTDANLSACIKNISDYADEVGKPCVISLSLGSHYGPHDGTGDFAEICKQYTGPGKIIVYAASNDAGEPIYHHKNATSTDPAQTVLTTDTRSNYNVDYGMATSWARTPGVELAARFFVVNTSTNKIVWTSKEISATDEYAYDDGTFGAEWSVSDTGEEGTALSSYFTAYNNDSEYGYLCGYLEENDLNGKWCFTSLLYYLKPVSNNYKIAISVYPKNNGVSVFVDSWPASYITFTSSTATYNNKEFTAGSDICSVSDESTFPTVISVGSYCSSKYWYGGTSSGSRYSWTNDGVYGQISSFSSYQPEGYGPLGIKLPWITAPGEVILSAYNSGYSTSSYYYAYGTSKALGAMSGTSQAAPCVAGITALWLQANPTLTPDKVKTVMKETAITDTYTSGTYASHFGNGKIDALAGVKYILDNTSITPIVRASATKVNFTDAYATKEYSQKVTIRGLYLQEGITLSLSGSDAFTIDQTSITQTEGTATAEVTITFKPLVAGMETATLTLSSTNAESVTVSISGIAEAATPTIITDKTELSFSTDLTNAASETLAVSGRFLSKNVAVALDDANGVFSVDQSSVHATEEGVSVNVSFQSSKAGSFTGKLTLSSTGAQNVSVNLTGEAMDGGSASDPYLNISRYATIDEAGWRTALVNTLYKYAEFTDNGCAWLTMPVYGGFVGANYTINSSTYSAGAGPQKWISSPIGTNNTYTGTTWTNTASVTKPFYGSSSYFTATSGDGRSRAMGQSSSSSTIIKAVSFYVTNTIEVMVSGTGRSGASSSFPAALKVYECTKNNDGTLTVSTSTTKNVASSSTSTFTLDATDLDATKIYKVEASIYRGYLYEIAFKTPLTTPELITDYDALAFEAMEGETDTQKLGVLGSDLRGDVTATLSDENNVFSLSETTVTKADAEEGKELSVTFSPAKAGEYTGTVTLTSPGVAAVTVMLSATATAQPVVDNSETFQLVTDASTLHANDIILVVYGAGSRALSAALSEGNRTSAAVTITDNSIVLDKDNNNVARICLGGNSSAWTFYDTNNTPGYLFNDGADGFLNTQETAGNYAKATISIGSDGNAIVTFNAQGSYNLLSYYIDPDDDGPGGGDITPPLVGAKLMSVGSTSVSECFTFGDAISTEKGYYSVQIYKKKEKVIDVNMDGQLNISDVTMLVDYILGKNPNPCNVSDCDVNGDGVINISDVTALVDKILGK